MLQPKRNNVATRQDSIAVKEDSKRILKEYLDRGYKPTNIKFPNETLDETLIRAKSKTGTTEVIRNNIRKPEKYNSNEFRTDVNDNQYRQRESANGVLNMDITPALYDKRIKPVRTINLMGTESGTYNDGVSIPAYDTMEIGTKPPKPPTTRDTIVTPKPKQIQVSKVTPKKVTPTVKAKEVVKPSKYRETSRPQVDTLSKQNLGVNRIRENASRAIETLNIVKPRK